jgi:fructosamine-3-kinase
VFFKHIIEEKLSQKIIYVSALAGGDINQVFKLKTNGETFVVKVNGERRFPQLFEKEKLGLHLLADTGIKTPEVIAEFKKDSMQFLVLQYIEEENKTSAFWNNFASYIKSIVIFVVWESIIILGL